MSDTATRTDAHTGAVWGLNRRTAALVFGSAFLLIGVLGPIVAGARGDLVVFGRNYLHDAVHVGGGLAGIAAALYDRGGTHGSTSSASGSSTSASSSPASSRRR